MRPLQLLHLDDDPFIRESVIRAIGGRYRVISAGNYQEALDRIQAETVDGALVDIHLAEQEPTGIDFLVQFRKHFSHVPVVMGSGAVDVATIVKCLKLGADDYLPKPFQNEVLVKKLDKWMKIGQHAASPILNMVSGKDPIIGSHEKMQSAKRLVERAENLRILFYGETGVGKTPFARYSNRLMKELTGTERPFEQINCACLNPEHFHDQLFGHRRGAFTGAISDKKGLVELARGGDLFLDEIGDMPLETQAHFLTFLDTMEYYPLGEDRKRKAEVRVLCATNRDLRAMVSEGKFRRDLFSRVSQVIVEIPPLRERRSDLRALLEYFIHCFVGSAKPYDESLVEALQNYDWTEGNVRELRDAVEFLCLMSRRSDRIELEHLGDRFRGGRGGNSAFSAGASQFPCDITELGRVGLERFLEGIERQLLERFLTEGEGSLEEMAKQLRVSRPTLYRRLKKYSLLSRSLRLDPTAL